jgi:predicted nucleotidyltransferase
MYPATLSKTSVEIVAFLAGHIGQSYPVRQISVKIGKDYKITYDTTKKLAAQGVLEIERSPRLVICRLNLRSNTQFLSFIESLRFSHFVKKKPDLRITVAELLPRIQLAYFTAILFGSHVKGTATEKSDLDILFIIPDQGAEKIVSSTVASVERMVPKGLHEVILTYEEFSALLKENKPNVAKEAVENHIVAYGAEPFYRILSETL